MSMFGIVAKLGKLLSDNNVRYLDVLLTALVQKQGSPVYDQLWSWFSSRFPDNPNAGRQAWAALQKLQGIVREYRDGRNL